MMEFRFSAPTGASSNIRNHVVVLLPEDLPHFLEHCHGARLAKASLASSPIDHNEDVHVSQRLGLGLGSRILLRRCGAVSSRLPGRRCLSRLVNAMEHPWSASHRSVRLVLGDDSLACRPDCGSDPKPDKPHEKRSPGIVKSGAAHRPTGAAEDGAGEGVGHDLGDVGLGDVEAEHTKSIGDVVESIRVGRPLELDIQLVATSHLRRRVFPNVPRRHPASGPQSHQRQDWPSHSRLRTRRRDRLKITRHCLALLGTQSGLQRSRVAEVQLGDPKIALLATIGCGHDACALPSLQA
jgi:hypothetical protein